jgi:hypothetical protein
MQNTLRTAIGHADRQRVVIRLVSRRLVMLRAGGNDGRWCTHGREQIRERILIVRILKWTNEND